MVRGPTQLLQIWLLAAKTHFSSLLHHATSEPREEKGREEKRREERRGEDGKGEGATRITDRGSVGV